MNTETIVAMVTIACSIGGSLGVMFLFLHKMKNVLDRHTENPCKDIQKLNEEFEKQDKKHSGYFSNDNSSIQDHETRIAVLEASKKHIENDILEVKNNTNRILNLLIEKR